MFSFSSTILPLFFLCLAKCSPIGDEQPKVLANDVVTSCDQVIEMYAQVGYPVTDCVLMSQQRLLTYLYYRVDTQLSFQDARLACKTAQNADLATASLDPDQQLALNDLYRNKFTMDTWMWIGLARINNSLQWIDGSGSPPLARWFPFPDSTAKDCTVMLMLTDTKGVNDMAGTFYYTEDCNSKYISVCQASLP